VDLTFWILWSVGFAAGVLLLYRFVPVRGARRRAEGKQIETRECPACGQPMSPSSAVCDSCGGSSTPWIRHRGNWWCKQDDVYLWLDEQTMEWRRYRRASTCPYCNGQMAVHERTCPACGRKSNPLELPDPLSDIPEEVERVEG
jgi:predicted amidophosphoribosyltransferase